MKTLPPVDLNCKKRGCGGYIEVPDSGEIGDGVEGECHACRRIYVATEFPDEIIMLYDRNATDRYKRRLKEKGTERNESI